MKRFLITTALEKTWRDDEPVLFLGEWCRRYSRRERWSKLDAEVLPYHWDDRAKLYADYQYLRDFYERLLQGLTGQLNKIHGVDHSLRYWRILIGPWLGYFTQILFDRWESIHQAVDRYELTGTLVLTGREDSLVPHDMGDFTRLFIGDEWNHHLYGCILRQSTKVSCDSHARRSQEEAPNTPPAVSMKQLMMQTLSDWYLRGARICSSENDAFMLATYLPFLDEMRMHLRMGQLPQPWRSVPPVQAPFDDSRRRWALDGEGGTDFESCVRALIPRQIPTLYLEGYGRLVEQTAGLPWPRRPKLIWTSNSHNYDEVFKAWAAQKVDQGVPLVVGQHGGHDGTGRWSFTEDHKIAISDCYLSWGWTDPAQPKVRPVGQLKAKRPLGVQHARQPGMLLVTTVNPRYSYSMSSVPVSGQWLDYFADQFAFVEHLPQRVRDALTVRLYSVDWDWDQTSRWRDRFPSVHVDKGDSNIDDLIRRSRLYVSTYNATTFLESFTMDVPTVIYWNPRHWELRDSAIPYFEGLKRVGIFHETPESAARHAAAIWDDVDGWWSSPAVQGVLEGFKTRHCCLPDNLLNRVDNALREVVVDHPAEVIEG